MEYLQEAKKRLSKSASKAPSATPLAPITLKPLRFLCLSSPVQGWEPITVSFGKDTLKFTRTTPEGGEQEEVEGKTERNAVLFTKKHVTCVFDVPGKTWGDCVLFFSDGTASILKSIESENESEAKTNRSEMLAEVFQRSKSKQQVNQQAEAFQKLLPLLEQQVELVESYTSKRELQMNQEGNINVLNPLAQIGNMIQGDLLVRSVDAMQECIELRRVYCCANEDALYCFRDKTAQLEAPSELITLQDALVYPVESMENQGLFCFTVETAMQSILLQAKHKTSRDLWVETLERIVESKRIHGDEVEDSLTDLSRSSSKLSPRVGSREEKSIEKDDVGEMNADWWNTMVRILRNKQARAAFREMLKASNEESILEFYLRARLLVRKCRRYATDAVKRAEELRKQASSQREGTDELDEEEEEEEEEDCEEEEEEDFLADLEEASLELTSEFVDPDGDQFCPVLKGELEWAEQKIREQMYEQSLSRCISKAWEHMEALAQTFPATKFCRQLIDTIERNKNSHNVFAEAQTLFGDKVVRITKRKDPSFEIVFPLRDGTTKIGRDQTNNLVLNHPKVSRLHCMITVDDLDRCVLRDVGSATGTKVNRHRACQKGLKLHDIIAIGPFRMQLLIDQTK